MSGRRNHDGESGRTLGEHLKAELRGVLRLLLKNTARRSVPLLNSPAWTSFQIDIQADYAATELRSPSVQVSPNVVSFSAGVYPTVSLPLLHPDAIELRRDGGRPIVKSHTMPPLLAATAQTRNVALPCLDVGAIGRYKTISCQDALKQASLARTLTIPKASTSEKRVLVRLSAIRRIVAALPSHARLKSDARMDLWPLQKVAIPLHRFAPAMRQAFRQALADKCDAPPGQIQLLLIFDRMDMGAYASIRQEGQGSLLCIPKPKSELFPTANGPSRGRSRLSSQSRAQERSRSAFLIIGLRLDTRQEVRALLPMSASAL